MKIFDTHVHTKEVSTCGQVSGARMAEIYKAAGYDGIVITDHLTPDYFRHDSKTMTWEQFAENHMSGYHAAKKKGDEIGLKVLYGCELRFEGSVNDYLVYGMPNSFIAEHPEIFDMQIKAFSEIADKNGFLVFHAHPFRNDMKIIDPSWIHGVEVFNGKPEEDPMRRNAFANLWADTYGLQKLSGSDCHMPEQAARAGICLFNDVETIEDFVREIKDRNYIMLESPTARKTDISRFNI